jgi:hypothetical protein
MLERTTHRTLEEYRLARNEAKNMCCRKTNYFRRICCKIFRINLEETKEERTTKAFITLNMTSNRGQTCAKTSWKL